MPWFKKKRPDLGTAIHNLEERAADFLQPKTFNWRRFFAIALSVIAALFLVFAAPACISGVLMANHGVKIVENGENLADSVNENDWLEAKNSLVAIERDLEGLNQDFNWIGPLSWIPPLNKPVRVARQLAAAAVDLIQGYEEALTVIIETDGGLGETDLIAGLASPEYRKEILRSISENQGKILQIRKNINEAKIKLENISTDDLNSIFKEQILFLNRVVTEAVANTDTALPIFANLPEILGYRQERNYLLVFQNNMEMRATGGFIGSYGLVKVKDGEIKSVFTDDIYHLDRLSEGKLKVLAPEQMLKYNNQKYWYLRDANWSPDWPASAEQILWFFNQERRNAGLPFQKLDGIIAVTPEFIANLIGVVGNLEARGVVFDEHNFSRELEQFVEFDYVKHGLKESERKSIISTLTNMIIQKAYDLPAREKINLWLAFKKNIDQKNILVYLLDPEIQECFNQKNWSGQVKQTDGDYIMVVDSNLAALKTDSVMEKSLAYQLKIDKNNDLIARLSLRYKHQGKAIPGLISRYRDYVRIYVPDGTWFLKASLVGEGKTENLEILKDLTVGSELGKKYAAAFFTVEPGREKTLVLEYRLPEDVKKQYQEKAYKLLVQKQSGTIGHNLQIDLGFEKHISDYYASDLPVEFSGKSIQWNTDLRVDREYLIKF